MGSATTVVNRFIKLLSVGVAIRYHVSFHTKVREFCSLEINPKVCLKELTVNTNPNNQSQSTVVPRDTVAPCPYVYRHSGVRTV